MTNSTDYIGNIPLVSIIIPCFNAEKWIESAIQSALDQTWPNKEVIVIDDGSRDLSLSVIKKFGKKVVVESGPNKGGCVARNRGVELAHGEWIQFLDADDVLLPDCIAAKMAAPRTSNERICCDLAPLEAANAIPFPDFWNASRYDLDFIIRFGPPQTAAPLLRREDLQTVNGFRVGLQYAQEFELYSRLAIRIGITFVSHRKIGVLIRQRKGSVSDRPYHEWPLIKGNILVDAVQSLKDAKCDQKRCRDAIAQRLTFLARDLYRNGRFEDAARFASEARRISTLWYEGVYKSLPATLAARALGFTGFEAMHRLYRTLGQSEATRPLPALPKC